MTLHRVIHDGELVVQGVAAIARDFAALVHHATVFATDLAMAASSLIMFLLRA